MGDSLYLLLYARVLTTIDRRFFTFVAICKGFKEYSGFLLLYARVLRRVLRESFDIAAIRKGFMEMTRL